MRIERLVVRAFGRIRDFETGADPLSRLVVVSGPNEAGKSSLFRFLSALLYGFYPASRDGNPHAPWNGEDIDGEAHVVLDDGERVEVHRRLLSSPWGRISADGEVRDLRNREVPWAGHVPRRLFEEVYALTLGDLARLEAETWRTVQDRLLGSLGADDLRPVREVVETLESDANTLWRPDRRGKPTADALEALRDDLRDEAREAKRRDDRLRETVEELRSLERRIEEVRRERDALQAEHDRAAVLRPVRERLQRIRELERAAGDPEALCDLPPEPGAKLDSLDERLDSLDEEIAREGRRRERLRERVSAYGEDDRTLVGRAREIRRLVVEAGAVDQARARIAHLDDRITAACRRRDGLARELLGMEWRDVDADALEGVAVAEVRERVARAVEAAERERTARERLRALEELEAATVPAGTRRPPPLLGGAVLLGGVATAAWAVVGGRLELLGLAALLLLVGFVELLRHRARRRDQDARRRERTERLERARSDLGRAEDDRTRRVREVMEALDPLPVAERLRERPDPRLADGVERLRETHERVVRHEEERARLREELEELQQRVERLAGPAAPDLPPDPVGAAARLEEALRAAEKRRDDAQEAERALEEDEDRRALEERREDLAARREALRRRLARLGEGDPDAGLEEAERRLEARSRAEELRQELEWQHPDLEDLRERIRSAERDGERWTADEADAADAARRIRERTDRLEEMVAEAEGLRHRIQELREARGLADVEGEREAVEERLRALRRRRDRLHLLARIVTEADRRFREEHQPDLLRRASEHLARITDGRYDRLWLREGDLDGTLLLRGPEYPHALEVSEPVSDGTRDQVYLALRLAIVDHLDQGRESLPLFIDEAFVQWDPHRRERGFDLLAELSRERQIFVFTCHESMARSLEERGGDRIRLDGPA